MNDAVLTGALRKAMWRIVPYLMLLYLMSFLNRVNIGFAALSMNEDIGIGPAVFGLGAGVFALGYCLFEVPSNLVLTRVGARRWIARIMVTWGVVSACFAFVQGPYSFAAMRFLLGVAEAGFFPGMIFYLTSWFPARNRAAVIAAFMTAAPISTAVGSPLSGVIMGMVGENVIWGLKDWQWLFVLEAIPTIILGFVTLRVLADRPRTAKWLTPQEAEAMEAAIASENAAKANAVHHSVWKSLSDPRVLALGAIYFGTSAGLYTVGIWAPLMLDEYELSKLRLSLLNAIPSVVATVGMVLWARHSDRRGERTWHVVLPCLLAAAGLAWAANLQGLAACVAALSVASLGISACKPPLWSVPTMFLGGAGAAAGIALINSIGNLGGAVGPYVIGALKESTGSYAGGLYVVAGFLAFSAVLTLFMARVSRRSP